MFTIIWLRSRGLIKLSIIVDCADILVWNSDSTQRHDVRRTIYIYEVAHFEVSSGHIYIYMYLFRLSVYNQFGKQVKPVASNMNV